MSTHLLLGTAAVLLSVPVLGLDVPQTVGGECLCESSLIVSDCCCDFRSASRLNAQHLRPLLTSLTESAYFKYFRVVLCESCPYTKLGAKQLCGSPECPVCTCSKQELPCDSSGKCFLEPAAPKSVKPPDCPFGGVDGRAQQPQVVQTSSEPMNPWTLEPVAAAEYVDLHKNPER